MKRPQVILSLRLMTIVILSILMGILLNNEFWFSALFTFIIILIISILIILKQQKNTESFKRMLSSINFSDFSSFFPEKGNAEIDSALAREMNDVLRKFKEKTYRTEENQLYYETLLRTIDSGLLIININREIIWCNKATLNLFGLSKLETIQELENIHIQLPRMVTTVNTKDDNILRINKDGQIVDLLFNTVLFKFQGREFYLVNMKNIHNVLETKEIESWQKLIRVLTHEIMNSLAPIISLSETMIERSADLDNEDDIMHQALSAIHRRSKGLLDFVQNYRKLTRIPPPEFSHIKIKELFSYLQNLYSGENKKYNFQCLQPDLVIKADRSHIEQVIINLIRNAEDATKDKNDQIINITATEINDTNKITISVSDNGNGISPEAIDKIFVPFFTTKPNGSGIGLSLCNQIMKMNNGTIQVDSQQDIGTTVKLTFYK